MIEEGFLTSSSSYSLMSPSPSPSLPAPATLGGKRVAASASMNSWVWAMLQNAGRVR